MSYVVAVLLLALGVAAVVYGGADDSPGLQLIGVLIAAGAVVLAVRAARRGRARAGAGQPVEALRSRRDRTR